jgi:hypothetical protein
VEKLITNEFMDMTKSAVFSEDKIYRYRLSRIWKNIQGTLRRLVFIMLNPSTADAMIEDPTIRRCMGFANEWGYGILDIANAFALRSTHPSKLKEVEDPVGPENDKHLRLITEGADLIIVAWGVHGKVLGRGRKVAEEVLADRTLHCLGKTLDGDPRHPLYLRADTKPIIYREAS